MLALLATAIFLLWHIRVVAVPLFIALLFATVLLPLTDRLTSLGLPRAVSVLIAIVVLIAVLSVTTTLIVGSIIGEAGQISDLVSSGAAELAKLTQPGNSQFGHDRAAVRSVLADVGPGLKTAGAGLLSKAASEASAVVSILIGAVISVAFLIYLLSDAAGLRNWVVAQGGPRHRVSVERALSDGWATLSGYVRGTLIVAIFDAVLIGIAAVALGLPIAGTLIAVTFFAAFIPILGAWIAGLIVVLVALAAGGVETALIMIAVQLVVRGAESLWVAPITYGKTVFLHPIAILASVTVGAALMGVLGAVIAVPVVAFLWVAFKELRSEWAQQGEAPAA